MDPSIPFSEIKTGEIFKAATDLFIKLAPYYTASNEAIGIQEFNNLGESGHRLYAKDDAWAKIEAAYVFNCEDETPGWLNEEELKSRTYSTFVKLGVNPPEIPLPIGKEVPLQPKLITELKGGQIFKFGQHVFAKKHTYAIEKGTQLAVFISGPYAGFLAQFDPSCIVEFYNKCQIVTCTIPDSEKVNQ